MCPFIFPWYESTRSGALQPFKCTVHSCRGLELWLHSFYNGVWLDSRSSHFSQLCTYTPHEKEVFSHPVILKTSFVYLYAKQLTNSLLKDFWQTPTFQHEASCTLPRIAVSGTSTDVDKLCSRSFLLCTPFRRKRSGNDAIYRSVRDYVIETHIDCRSIY